ncbi:hypothetical protein C1752_01259 [Acaryochloris thomasi RCC1774]|uniref:Cobalamin biosynthesis protein CobQ n=1 Tax=Acaryochloris thomasi RCC1774 TaxID=1764569 RepID=A0A2W1JLT6_9CYAN|nr:hypothetical protein [Acaryochloris thomasi]PZD74333.1 hypothetical protein C1752_01259 [Acaryochloris thomasi RCC1774]
MNTPAHIVINLLCLGRSGQGLKPIVTGALLPDAPMLVFYLVEKLRGTSEQDIWRHAYYQPHWQNFIDIFNSIPLVVLGMAIMVAAGSVTGLILGASMLLHLLEDLPVHHDDAHRHFFPLSNWRFESPISYWDSNHYGGIVSALEIVAVIVGCIFLWRIYRTWGARLMLGTIGLLYASFFIYAFTTWI